MRQVIITSRSLSLSRRRVELSVAPDTAIGVTIILVLSSFFCSSFPFFFLFIFQKKATIVRITRIMIIGRQAQWLRRRCQSSSIVCGRKKGTQRKLSSTIELFISIASSLLTDWPEPGPDMYSHSFLFSFSFSSFSLSLVWERRSFLYILPSLFSLFGFFPSSSPSITAIYMQTFSSRLLLLVGHPVRSLARSFARAATASNSVVDTS
jgi:hypothetical protein